LFLGFFISASMASSSASTPAWINKHEGSLEKKKKKGENQKSFEKWGMTIPQARNVDALDLAVVSQKVTPRSYSITHPRELTPEEKDSVKKKLLDP
jgi:hypothetical protein